MQTLGPNVVKKYMIWPQSLHFSMAIRWDKGYFHNRKIRNKTHSLSIFTSLAHIDTLS